MPSPRSASRLLFASAVLVLSGCGRRFSAEAPLGTFEALDKELVGMGLEKSAWTPQGVDLPAGAEFFAYADAESEKMSGFFQRVYVGRAGDGKLKAVGAVYTPAGGSLTVKSFLFDFWKAVAGSPYAAGDFDKARAKGTRTHREPAEYASITAKE